MTRNAPLNVSYLVQSLRHMSPGQVAVRYAFRGLQRTFGIQMFHGYILTPRGLQDVGNAPSGATFGWVEPSRLRAETEDPESGMTQEQLDQALEDGEECFGAFVDGVLACHLWITQRTAHLYEDVYVAFDPSYWYGRWAYTRQKFRGRHLQAHCKAHAFEAVVRRGGKGGLGLVSASNFASIRSTERVGCTRAGVLVATGSGSPERSLWASPQCAKYDLRLKHGALRPAPRPHD